MMNLFQKFDPMGIFYKKLSLLLEHMSPQDMKYSLKL